MHVSLGWGYRRSAGKQETAVYVACDGERGLAARAEAFSLGRARFPLGLVPASFRPGRSVYLVRARANLTVLVWSCSTGVLLACRPAGGGCPG